MTWFSVRIRPFYIRKVFCLFSKGIFSNFCGYYYISMSLILKTHITLYSDLKLNSFSDYIDFFKYYAMLDISIYLLKVNKTSIRTRCEISSKLTRKTPEQRHFPRSGVFINFEHISLLVLTFLLFTLNM